MMKSKIVSTAAGIMLTAVATGSMAQQSPASLADLRPTVNFYGLPGLIDMPSAEAQPDGELNLTVSSFGGITRNTLAFQLSPRISGAFRYASFRNWNSNGFDTYFDRSFDLRYQLFFEGRYRPAVAIGLQDFAGTGVSAGEYIVATKTLGPGLTVSGGLGWGRLGSFKSIGSPFGATRPAFDVNSTGGQFSYDQWFRGPAAPFAGIQWRPNERLGFKLEYSSDAYFQETVTRNIFDRKSPWNFGLEYQVNETTRLGGYALYGDTIGIMASFALNPARQNAPYLDPAPDPFPRRPDREMGATAWETDWADSTERRANIGKQLQTALAAEGQYLVGFNATAVGAQVQVENTRFLSSAAAIGRIARSMAKTLPASVETFRITLMDRGLPLSTVIMRRSDLEALELQPSAAEELRAVSAITAASSRAGVPPVSALYPRFEWSIGPYFRQSLFDPSNPVLFEVGAEVEASFEFAPGLQLSGVVQQEVYSTLDRVRVSPSALPQVRTLGGRYEQGSGPVIDNLTLSYVHNFGNDFYARATAGYLERMFGGVSGEVLWKPMDSALALGVEVNYAKQRDFDGLFGFIDYDVITGHASAYYDWGNGFHTQIDVGRYLAGDWGATLSVDREFSNGWRVGAFATITDVSSADFGEGSFDKGIRISIPIDWATGRASTQRTNTVIRPIQRDGGARLQVPGRLYDRLRAADARQIDAEWPRIWR